MCAGARMPEGGVRSPGAGVTGGCELHDTVLGTKLRSCSLSIELKSGRAASAPTC